MTTREILRKNTLSPLDTELLLSHALNEPREYLFAHPEKKLTKLQVAKFYNFIRRRAKGEPVAYITGKKEFYGLEFLVNKNVLIPRPETELLVESALKKILTARYLLLPATIIDVGTGSGNIITSIVKNIPAETRKKISFFATDISKKALLIAKKNAKKHKVEKSIKFIQSDLLEYFLKNKPQFENLMIVANLSYVSRKLYRKNSKDLKYEPKKALLSGKGGLEHYERLIKQIKETLFNDHCSLIIEISSEQKIPLSKILKKQLSRAKIIFFKDLAGRLRIAKISLS